MQYPVHPYTLASSSSLASPLVPRLFDDAIPVHPYTTRRILIAGLTRRVCTVILVH